MAHGSALSLKDAVRDDVHLAQSREAQELETLQRWTGHDAEYLPAMKIADKLADVWLLAIQSRLNNQKATSGYSKHRRWLEALDLKRIPYFHRDSRRDRAMVYVRVHNPSRRDHVVQFASFFMGHDTEARIAINHDRGGRTYYVKVNPVTLRERIAYVRSVDLHMTRLQLAEDAGLWERAVTRIAKGAVTNPLLANALALAEALGGRSIGCVVALTNPATTSTRISEREFDWMTWGLFRYYASVRATRNYLLRREMYVLTQSQSYALLLRVSKNPR